MPELPLELDLDEEQQQLLESTRGFLARHYPLADARAVLEGARVLDREGWRRAAEMGWTAILAGEELSGLEAGAPEATVVAEELGRAVNWTPFLGNALAAAALAGPPGRRNELRDGSAARALLERLVAGEASAAWAGPEPRGESWGAGRVETEARRDGEGFVIDGAKRLVVDADLATDLVVTARLGDELVDFLVPVATAGVSIEPARTLDLTRRFPTVRLQRVAVDGGARVTVAGASPYDRVLDLASVLVAADSLGAAERLLEMTVSYSLDRIAFERPIGSYQAVKHFCADMLLRVEATRAAVRNAALSLGADDPDAARAVAVAGSYAADATTWIAGVALQVHGGIGFTWEHDLHLFLRRIEADAALFRSARAHRRRLAEMVF
ncbi:MAG TPA: acyl-CoA dehydrogenase family protein [Solirubrobacterales bacterium]|nr:acyl-CoA dehydrogenase family protein [Solirubrobacterales bacterium]